MSKISTVYDAIILKINTIFSSKQRLHNPYFIEQNNDLVRRDGWGLGVLDATRENLEFCDLSIKRSFKFVLIRQFVSLEGKEDGFDAVTKYLLEDQQTFLNAFWATNQIGQLLNIEEIDFDNISGILQLVDGEKKYLYTEINFTITISELVA